MGDEVGVEIILPECSEDHVSDGLRLLTERIHGLNPESVGHGVLGGMFGYGADYENDVFVMRPFYWGDCDCGYEEAESRWSAANKHAPECYQTELNTRLREEGVHWECSVAIPWSARRRIEERIYRDLCSKHGKPYPDGCAVHCTCPYEAAWRAWSEANDHADTCSLILPNFRHKPSGFEVRWYKYIGRGMETVGSCDIATVVADCLASLGAQSQ